jgi:hydroxymethylpyrimidine/phosphomethylpyrimidine kinase
MTRTALTISLSDSSGVAGIQADLKTFAAYQVHGMSIIAGIAAENTQAIEAIFPVSDEAFSKQLAAITSDIDVHAVKIGSLFSSAHARIFLAASDQHDLGPLVIDPTIMGFNGRVFLEQEQLGVMRDGLFPRASIIIPNAPELAAYAERPQAESEEEVVAQARIILGLGPRAVLATGGYHTFSDDIVDYLVTSHGVVRLTAPRILTRNLRGTSCTLSSAIAAALATGDNIETAVRRAKSFVTAAIEAGVSYRIGMGAGPIHQLHATWKL